MKDISLNDLNSLNFTRINTSSTMTELNNLQSRTNSKDKNFDKDKLIKKYEDGIQKISEETREAIQDLDNQKKQLQQKTKEEISNINQKETDLRIQADKQISQIRDMIRTAKNQ